MTRSRVEGLALTWTNNTTRWLGGHRGRRLFAGALAAYSPSVWLRAMHPPRPAASVPGVAKLIIERG